MDEATNPIQGVLYDWLEEYGEKNILKELNKDNPKLISKIIEQTYPKIVKHGKNKEESVSILTTSLLHYLFTIMLIPSQRKIIHKNIEINIIIPDRKKLGIDPNKVLIIEIPDRQNKTYLEKRLKELASIQPVKNNIWLVLDQRQDVKNKMFCINDRTFPEIINEVKKFLNNQSPNRLKIFKS